MPDSAIDVARSLADALDRLGVPYALGGAIALGAHGVPRMTFDVDINVGLSGDSFFSNAIIDTLHRECGVVFEKTTDTARELAARDGFVRGQTGDIKVDVFFPSMEYLKEVMSRSTKLPLLDREVAVIGMNDLVVMKTVFGRPKDFADIESLSRHGREPIDRAFVSKCVHEIMHPTDASERLDVLDRYLSETR